MADVFISYSRKDRTWLESLTQILEKSGITCWTAPRNLTNAYNYEEQIPNAIAECSLLVFLASRNSVKAKGCQGELTFASNLKKVILPIYLEPVQMPASQSPYSVGIQPIHLYRDYGKGLDWVKTAVLDYLGKAENKEHGSEIAQENMNPVAEDVNHQQQDTPRVFISHDSDDASRVAKYVKLLEGNDIPCWIAPRDIPYGSNYAREIPSAIENCCCVLVFVSKHSQTSENIEKEIEIAVEYRKKIIPVRLENCEFKGSYIYHLKNKQWFDAYNYREEDIRKLINSIGGIEDQVSKKPSEDNVDISPKIISVLALLAVAIILVGIIKIGENLLREIRASEMMSLLFALLIPILCIICIVSYKIFKKKK